MSKRSGCVVAASLALAAIVGPVLLGATPPGARFSLECLMAAAALVWAVVTPRSWRTLVAMLAVAVCVGIQAASLPQDLLLQVASGPAVAWKVAAAEPARSWCTISVDPHATILAGCRLFLGVATVFVVADVANATMPRRLLQAGLAMAALVTWGLGLAFPPKRDNTRTILGSVDLSGPIEFWLTPLKRPLETAAFGYRRVVDTGGDSYPVIDWGVGDGFGSYVSSNHFAGAIVFTLPMALAWVLFLTRHRLPAPVRYAVAVAVLAGALWTVGAMAGSRAGIGALLVAGTVFVACAVDSPIARRAWGGVALGCSMVVGAVAILLYGGWQGLTRYLPGPLHKPMMSLLTDSRALATAFAKRLFWSSPWFGTGLSTYGEITAHSESNAVPWYFAHNDYAQWAAETGLVGIAIAVSVAVVFLRRGVRFYGQPFQAERILAAGAWGGLAGISAHAAFDYNLHVPANAFLACLVAGLALATVPPAAASPATAPPSRQAGRIRLAQRALTGAFSIACLVAVGLLGCDYQAAGAEARLRRALTAARIALADPAKPLPVERLERAIFAGEQMAAQDSHNPQLSVLLGQANLVLASAPQPIDQANERRQAAKAWFQQARQNSAVCLGVPVAH